MGHATKPFLLGPRRQRFGVQLLVGRTVRVFALRREPSVALTLGVGGFCNAGAVSSPAALSVTPSHLGQKSWGRGGKIQAPLKPGLSDM